MKKYSFIAFVVLAFALSACTHKELLPMESFGENAWMYDETLPVPIQFNGSDPFSLTTKGVPINSLSELVGSRLDMAAVDLSDPTALTSYTAAPVFFTNAKVEIGAGGTVSFLNDAQTATIKRYYPMNNASNEVKYNYSFIGYKVPDSRLKDVTTGSPTTLRFNYIPKLTSGVDYNMDVLWGRCDATDLPDGKKGFNGPYIRAANELNRLAEFSPSLALHHLSSLIHIVVRSDGSASAAATYLNSDNTTPIFTVKNLSVAVKRPVALLDLAEGTLVYDTSTSVSSTFYVYDTFTAYTANYGIPVVYPTETEYGTGVFLIPGVRTETDKPQMKFTLEMNNEGVITNTEYTVTLALPKYGDVAGEYGFEAGRQYTYYINVKPATPVTVTIESVDPWSNGSFDNGDGDNVVTFE